MKTYGDVLLTARNRVEELEAENALLVQENIKLKEALELIGSGVFGDKSVQFIEFVRNAIATTQKETNNHQVSCSKQTGLVSECSHCWKHAQKDPKV